MTTKIKISYDQNAHNYSPRENDNLGILLLRQFEEFDTLYKEAEKVLSSDQYDRLRNCEDAVEAKEFLESTGKFIVLNVYLYNHGSFSYSISESNPFGCPFDSGLAGWVIASKQAAREIFNVKRISEKLMERVIDALQAEMNVFEQYLNGEVFIYTIETDDDCDSCGGFFGSNFKNNGMKDYLPDNLWKLFEENNFELEKWLVLEEEHEEENA